MSSGVPNLSFDRFPIYIHAASGKLDADGGLRFKAELIPGEPREKVGFPNARIADQNHLEEVIVVIIRSVGHGQKLSAGPKEEEESL